MSALVSNARPFDEKAVYLLLYLGYEVSCHQVVLIFIELMLAKNV